MKKWKIGKQQQQQYPYPNYYRSERYLSRQQNRQERCTPFLNKRKKRGEGG